ncbi:MAG: HAD family hydrolase [Candidatus Thorarchaeota archaeon]
MIKAITFDLWNTLFENISYSDERLSILFENLININHNIQISTLRTLYNKYFSFINPDFKSINHHHVYAKERITHLLNDLKINLSSIELNSLIKQLENVMLKNPPSLKSGVKETLITLSQKYKLGIISDTGITPGRIIRIALNQYDLLNLFQITIFSDETGYYKPHIFAFKAALDKLECKPEDSIHIGDLLETDIKGAKNFKMSTIWLRSPSNKFQIDIQPDYEIDKISEVIEIVESIK